MTTLAADLWMAVSQIAAARSLLGLLDLDDALVIGEALHCRLRPHDPSRDAAATGRSR